MKSFNLGVKFLISLGFFLQVINFWTYYDPITAWKTFGAWQTLSILNNTFNILIAIAFIITVIRVWKNVKSSKNEKLIWTILIVFFAPIFGTYYIWILEDQFLERKTINTSNDG